VSRLLKQECLSRNQAGLPLSEETCRARFPQIDLAAADLLPYLKLSISDEPSSPGATLALDDLGDETITLPLHFDDYELLEEIGRGSMGIVYRAKQISRPRIVAVKILRSKLIDASSTAPIYRFQQEIKTATKLRHENIVCVFDVGESRGHHFFTMQYVRGQSLAQMTVGRPVDNRTAAEYLEQIAHAIHYAHRGGILHRDLKPANIIIDGDTNRPLVADFGLAKISEGDRSITAVGETLGTPAFMSPEQAVNASHATAQSDIYSLGATLYTILGGKPPFCAARSSETLRQVVEEYPTPLRRLNPDVDKDLETICMKCLLKAPGSRYTTAGELADDLGRYLRGDRISVGRWGEYVEFVHRARRNKSAVIPICLFVFLLMVGSFTLGYRLLVASTPDRQVSNRMNRAEQVVGEAINELIDDYSINASQKSSSEQALLQSFYEYYVALLNDSDDVGSNVQFEANVLLQMGRIQASRGQFSDAKDLLQTVIRRLSDAGLTIKKEDGQILEATSLHTADILAHVWFLLGILDEQLGNVDLAMLDFQQSLKNIKYLADNSQNGIDYRLLVARCNGRLGAMALLHRRWATAKECLEKATKEYQTLLEKDPDNVSAYSGLANCYFLRGKWERMRGNQQAYREYLEASVRELRHFVDKPQRVHSSKVVRPLITGCRDLGDLYAQQKDYGTAIKWYEKAFDMSRKSFRAKPPKDFHAIQASVLTRWAEVLRASGHTQAAFKKCELAFKTWEAINEQEPTVPEYLLHQAVAMGQCAQIQRTLGVDDNTLQKLQRAKTMLSQLVREHPGEAQFSTALENILHLQQQLKDEEEPNP
ncbi:MAG: protein kinase, partial [Pirellulales bacterium]|nr:protein kinase [Pirellulales bacterium]